MSKSGDNPTNLRRAVLLTTASSALVPIAGLLTQPLLARSLGVDGRGELAAAVAPSALVLGAATLGLPEAMVYFAAKHPRITRKALVAASVLTTTLGLLCLLGTAVALPVLSDGDRNLGGYILIAMSITVPALLVGTLRGAAMGRQMWREVAVERTVSTILRLALIGVLFGTGHLTVLTAIVTTVATPAVGALAYWRLAKRPEPMKDEVQLHGSVTRNLASYGVRVWLGSVAAVLLARTDQILMVPLSTVEQLGLYSVANVISDVPFLIVTAIASALTGTNSRSGDREQVALTTRLTLILGLLGSSVLAALTPVFLVPLFGAEFDSAILPTIILLGAALVFAPGFIAAAGLSSAGRPGLRSIGFCISLVINVAIFVALVPSYGALGACWASLITAFVFSSLSIASASRVLRLPWKSFVLSTRSDVRRVCGEIAKHPRARTR